MSGDERMTPRTPTDEERAAFKRAELHRSHYCETCWQEAAEAERARIRAAVEDIPNCADTEKHGRPIGGNTESVHREDVLAILDPRSDKEPT